MKSLLYSHATHEITRASQATNLWGEAMLSWPGKIIWVHTCTQEKNAKDFPASKTFTSKNRQVIQLKEAIQRFIIIFGFEGVK